MGEHKLKKPGEIKGQAYRAEQRRPLRGKWAVVAELGSRWPEKHVPGYLERKRKLEAEKKRKQAGTVAEPARGGVISPAVGEDPTPGDRGATGPELTPGENNATIGGEGI